MMRPEQLSIAAYRSALAGDSIELDGATALRAPEAPDSPMLNRIVALGVESPATEAQLDAAIAAMRGLTFYVTVSPDAEPADLADWLRARGFEPGWGWMQFRRTLEHIPEPETDLEIVEISPERGSDFARVVRVAYGLPEAVEPLAADAPGAEGWTCWLALDGDEPAGAAGLYVDGDAGYLGYAGTAPEHRGKGAQSALLAARLRRARELGCTGMYTETGERRPDRPSASYRNLVRAGFEELYVVPNWISGTARPATASDRVGRRAHRKTAAAP